MVMKPYLVERAVILVFVKPFAVVIAMLESEKSEIFHA